MRPSRLSSAVLILFLVLLPVWAQVDAQEVSVPAGSLGLRLCGELVLAGGTCEEAEENRLQCQVTEGQQCTLILTARTSPLDLGVMIEIWTNAWTLPLFWPKFDRQANPGNATAEYEFTVPSSSAGRQYRLQFFAKRADAAAAVDLVVVLDVVASDEATEASAVAAVGHSCSEVVTGVTGSDGEFTVTLGEGITATGRLAECTVGPLANQPFTLEPGTSLTEHRGGLFPGMGLDGLIITIPGFEEIAVTEISEASVGATTQYAIGDVCLPRQVAPNETTLFSDDFDAYLLASFPAPPWQLIWAGTGENYVTYGPSVSFPQSLQLEGRPNNSAVVQREFSASAETIGYEYSILIEAIGQGGLGRVESPGFFSREAAQWGRYYATASFNHDTQQIVAEDGTVLARWAPGHWYRVKVVLDRGTNRYDAWLDGVLVGQQIATTHSDTDRIDALALFSGHPGVKVWYDDVRVFTATGASEQAAEWHIDFQGSADHNGTYGQTGPVAHSEVQTYWNVFEVAALRQPWPTPRTTNPSMQLRDGSGQPTGVTFSILGDAYGWAGWRDRDSLTDDYLIILNGFGVTNDPTQWQIDGLAPNTKYTLTYYHHDHGPSSDRGIRFLANGVQTIVTGMSGSCVASAAVVSDNAGRITGTASATVYAEGDWAGLTIQEAAGQDGASDRQARDDSPPASQSPGEHSSIVVRNDAGGSDHIRDDELADMIRTAITAAEHRPTSVKAFFNSCFGGGMLDNIADMLASFDPPIPFVGGSASAADETAKGPSNAWVGDSLMGSFWTNALLEAIADAVDGERVTDTIARANANDSAADNNSVAQWLVEHGKGPEHPQNTTANGGRSVTWGPAETVVFSGANNRRRHDNNVASVEHAFLVEFGQTYGSARYGHTRDALRHMLELATAGLDGEEELILYVDDHGDTEFDIDEWWDYLFPGVPIIVNSPLGWSTRMAEEPFVLHPGWEAALQGNAHQGDWPDPALLVTVAFDSTEYPDGFPLSPAYRISFNDVSLAIPEGYVAAGSEVRVPVHWSLIKSGQNSIEIRPVAAEFADVILLIANLDLVSGPINELDVDAVVLYETQ